MSRCETTLSPEYPKLVPLKSAAFLSPSPLLKLLPAVHPSECLCASDPDGPNHLQAVAPWNACARSHAPGMQARLRYGCSSAALQRDRDAARTPQALQRGHDVVVQVAGNLHLLPGLLEHERAAAVVAGR